MCDNSFNWCTDPASVNALASLNLRLLRLNCASGSTSGFWTDRFWVNGVNNPDFSSMNNFFAVAYKFIPANCRLIVGVR